MTARTSESLLPFAESSGGGEAAGATEVVLPAPAAQARQVATPPGDPGGPHFPDEEVWQVLQRQAMLYTCGDSSSLPAELAGELLAGVWFCAATAFLEDPAPRPLAELLRAGQRALTRSHAEGLALQCAAQKASLPLENAVYRDALKETRRFYRLYDIRFFPHQIPSLIDYPLALPVEESLLGVDFINEYLRRRRWEDALCRRFALPEVTRRLAAFHPGWAGLPFNLFEPVLSGAVGCALLGEEIAPGAPAPGPAALWSQLRGLGAGALKQRLQKAASRMCNRLHIWNTAQRSYYALCAEALAPRLMAAKEEGFVALFVY